MLVINTIFISHHFLCKRSEVIFIKFVCYHLFLESHYGRMVEEIELGYNVRCGEPQSFKVTAPDRES